MSSACSAALSTKAGGRSCAGETDHRAATYIGLELDAALAALGWPLGGEVESKRDRLADFIGGVVR